LFLFLGRSSDERKPVLAVLPFTSLDSRDVSLTVGMWEDTRQAIGRNRQLIVLGPNTTDELAKKGASAANSAADYLVQASVRSDGERIRVSANLVRTRDGVQLWTQNFDRRLGDVFALQSEIAREIEGRIRGRLAEKGGIRPENIATSGQVYALFSDARAKILKRDPVLMPSAFEQLQSVVKIDPNFAPGWAALSQASLRAPWSRADPKAFNRPEAYARKAVELAPNLAAGHAALALALKLRGPEARAEIEKAVDLDPNDYEATLWLGNMLADEGRKREALGAYTRAADIEPLFWPAVLNKFGMLHDLGDAAGVQRLLEREQRLAAEDIVAAMKMELAAQKGHFGEAANVGIRYWKTAPPNRRFVIASGLADILLQLGYVDEATKISHAPDFAPYLWRNDAKGLEMMESTHIAPRAFFSSSPLTENAARVYILSGRGAKLAQMYLSLGASSDDFSLMEGSGPKFLLDAALVGIALRESGHGEEASRLFATSEIVGKDGLKGGRPQSSALLARVYAAEGRKEDALPLLADAVRRGWLPEPPILLLDLALDPALASLKGDPRFERIRQQVLGTIERERAQVRLDDLS
jgi:TolB-like protein